MFKLTLAWEWILSLKRRKKTSRLQTPDTCGLVAVLKTNTTVSFRANSYEYFLIFFFFFFGLKRCALFREEHKLQLFVFSSQSNLPRVSLSPPLAALSAMSAESASAIQRNQVFSLSPSIFSPFNLCPPDFPLFFQVWIGINSMLFC